MHPPSTILLLFCIATFATASRPIPQPSHGVVPIAVVYQEKEVVAEKKPHVFVSKLPEKNSNIAKLAAHFEGKDAMPPQHFSSPRSKGPNGVYGELHHISGPSGGKPRTPTPIPARTTQPAAPKGSLVASTSVFTSIQQPEIVPRTIVAHTSGSAAPNQAAPPLALRPEVRQRSHAPLQRMDGTRIVSPYKAVTPPSLSEPLRREVPEGPMEITLRRPVVAKLTTGTTTTTTSENSRASPGSPSITPDPTLFLQKVKSDALSDMARPPTPPLERKKNFWDMFKKKKINKDGMASPPLQQDPLREYKERMVTKTTIPAVGASVAFGPDDVPSEFLSPEERRYREKYGNVGSPLLQTALGGNPLGTTPVPIRQPSTAPRAVSGSRSPLREGSPPPDRDAEYSAYEELRRVELHERIKYRLKFYTSRKYNPPHTLHPHCHNVDPKTPLRFVCYAEEIPLVLNTLQMTALEKVLEKEFADTHVSVGSLHKPDSVSLVTGYRVLWTDDIFDSEYFTINVGDGCAYYDRHRRLEKGDASKVCWTIVAKNARKIPTDTDQGST